MRAVDGFDFGVVTTTAHQTFATYLREQGIERGDRVAANGTRRVEVLAAHLACWTLGAVSIPLSVLFGPDALQYRLADSGTKAGVVTEGGLEAFRG